MLANPARQQCESDGTFDVGRFDLNLLIVLRALLRFRSITLAANDVKLSQPATRCCAK